MTPTAASAADVIPGVLFGVLFAVLMIAGLYIWIALALGAVFRKSGEESWKAWVPILNLVVLVQLAGLSPWLVLLAFVPVVNIALLAFVLYRVNVAFGYGVGMTVLGVLLFPVWASVVGWGSARWVGREVTGTAQAAHAARATAVGVGARRSGDVTATLPPLPAFPSAAPAGPSAGPAFPSAASAEAGASGFVPPPPNFASSPAEAPVEGQRAADGAWPAASVDEPAPPTRASRARWAADDPIAADSPDATPNPAPVSVPERAWAPPVGGWTPPPLPGRPVSAAGAGEPVGDDPAASADVPWQGFALDSTDLSAEVTGAVPGAPAPISAVPASAPEPIPFTPDAFAAPEASTTSGGITKPPVARVPAPGSPEADAEPWRPARSPMNDADAFPESSGPVSAVAGAPDAGAPRSARSSVSAFHTKPEIPEDAEPEIPEDENVLDHTIIARRKRTEWSLVPPTGDPIALASDVVLLGRRPAPDPDFPTAQLIAIQDGTVSKTHARLRLRGEKWYVTDLNSTNGVLFATLMGTEVEATPGEEVEAGDRFLMGDAEIRLVRSEE